MQSDARFGLRKGKGNTESVQSGELGVFVVVGGFPMEGREERDVVNMQRMKDGEMRYRVQQHVYDVVSSGRVVVVCVSEGEWQWEWDEELVDFYVRRRVKVVCCPWGGNTRGEERVSQGVIDGWRGVGA